MKSSRRDFLRYSAAASLMGALPFPIGNPRRALGDPQKPIRVGLVGCGNRGRGAATNICDACPAAQIVSLADPLPENSERCLSALRTTIGNQCQVTPNLCFTGQDGYRDLMSSDLDVVLLASLPASRPVHIEEAMRRGIHIFAEKPAALDALGVRRMLAACQNKPGISFVSGLVYRYCEAKRAAVREIASGRIGEIRRLETKCSFNSLVRTANEGLTPAQTELLSWRNRGSHSGGLMLEIAIHTLDVAAWVMGEYPVSATGDCSRRVETVGDIYDNYQVTYRFKNGVELLTHTQINGQHEQWIKVWGTKGTCIMHDDVHLIEEGGVITWKPHKKDNEYVTQMRELVDSIQQGKPIVDWKHLGQSTVMAIMGRMAAHSGKTIDWDTAFNSSDCGWAAAAQ